MKTKRALFITLLAIVAVAALALFVACEDEKKNPDTYDMSAVTFVDKTVTYDGQEKDITVGGTLPEGVTVTYEYYKETVNENNKISNKPKNAGTYKVVAKFAGDDKHNPIEDKTATLTIEKADLSVTLGAKQYAESGVYKDLAEPIVFEKNQNGSYYREYDGTEYAISVVESNADTDDLTTNFFTSQQAAEDNGQHISDVIKNVGVQIFVRIELEENSESYDNFNTTTIITSVTIEKRTVTISNAAELDLLRTEMGTRSEDIRYNTKYVLTDDIDYGNQVWKTIAPANERVSWVGEFDGNGKKIFNFQITEESLGETNAADASNGLSFGFWGFLMDAYIHDVTFDTIKADINANEIPNYVAIDSATNPICFGIIAGRTRTGSTIGTQFENITVLNTDIKIITKGGFCGTIIGEEYAGAFDADHSEGIGHDNPDGKTIVRKNLDVNKVKIQVITCVSSDYKRLSIGGIVGELMFDSRTYEDCDVTNINLINGDETVKDIPNVMIANVGGFIGLEYSTYQKGSFKNCTIHNFKLEDYAGTDKADLGSYAAWSQYTIGQDAKGTGCDYIGCKASNDNDDDYGLFRHTYDAVSGWTVTHNESWRTTLVKGMQDLSGFIIDDRTNEV